MDSAAVSRRICRFSDTPKRPHQRSALNVRFTQTPSDVSWELRFLEILPLVENVVAVLARRYHLSLVDAEDFGSDVKAKLIEHDYRVLRTFQGRSSMRTFLTTVVTRLFHDRRNREWGKWRPSAVARRTGAAAILLERLMMRDRLSFQEACSVMTTNHRVAAQRSEFEHLASVLPVRLGRRFESDDVLTMVAACDHADRAVLDAHRVTVAERTLAVLNGALAELESQDARILAMRFTDGMRISDMAIVLNLSAKSLYARLARLLARLRNSLQARGIDASVMAELFVEP
jgi:RNA polymerase sigma factor (sigma-70 family)